MAKKQARPYSARSIPLSFVPLPLFLALCLLLPTAVAAQNIISEVTVIFGNSGGILPPAGYTKIPVDLNDSVGGDYIYVCYKKGVGAPVTGLAVTYDGASPPAGYAWTRINVDLNRDVGGSNDIFLWYTKDPDCSTIDDIMVQIDNSTFPDGYTRINADLNYGAGGTFIYIAYRKI